MLFRYGPLSALVAAALALGAAATGCPSTPDGGDGDGGGEARYPDLASPEGTWRTFLRAWSEGDVPALERCYAGVLRQELDLQIERNGRDAVAEWYRRDASNARFRDVVFYLAEPPGGQPAEDGSGERLRYVRATLAATGGGGDVLVRFSIVRIEGEWRIANRITVAQ